MNMKLWAFGSIVGWTTISAFQAPTYAQTSATATTAPSTLSEHSKDLSRERIEREATRANEDPRNQPIAEATAAVKDTRSAIHLLDQNKTKEAKATLADAIGKTDLLLSAHPDLALIPMAAHIRVRDTNADEATIKKVTGEIKTLVKQGEYQAARPLLQSLASELNITSVNLPMGSYPSAIRAASGLIDQGKIQEAKMQLGSTLQTLVIVEKSIPIPVLRAQALVDEVSRQAADKKIAKAQADQLLKEADQQLSLAESLGYGTKKDFAEIHGSINSVQQAVNRNQEPKSLIAKIESDLQSLRDRISKSLSA